MSDPRSRIPGVDLLVASEAFAPLLERFPRQRVVEATRVAIAEVRDEIARAMAGADGGASAAAVESVEATGRYAERVDSLLSAADAPSLRRVINATGVVLHTNLGRAPLAPEALTAMDRASAYTNLEYDLGEGRRGSRYVHCVSLLTELTRSEDALVVNNAAAALVLALNTVARGRGVAVSRGELVEIGGGFRIPEILERSGAELVEVGSTNRTRVDDYREALDAGRATAVLKVHRSNFRISGFTEEAGLAELAGLARAAGAPLIHDLGSGAMVDTTRLGLPPEPRAVDSVAVGADVVVASGDKLLGGPQAGIVVGRARWVDEMRRNPLCRALRVDKITLAALEATLRLHRDPVRALRDVPTLRMLATPEAEVRAAAEAAARRLSEGGVRCEVVSARGAVGGGTFPEVEIPSWAVAVDVAAGPDALAGALRDGMPAVVGRVVDGRLLLDLRTVLGDEGRALERRVLEAVGRLEGGA